MKKKLTLSIEEKVIESAQLYSHRKGESISHMVEEYLSKLPDKKKEKKKSWADRTAGILKGKLTDAQIASDPRLQYILSKIDK